MSDEKKLRDLLARLVAMSPEPPPYPEEVQMVTQEKKRSPRPLLVFAGAAMLVIALAVPLLLLFGGTGGETVATTTTLAPGTTTIPQQETTPGPTSTTTAAPEFIWHGEVVLAQEPDNSFLGNPALVPLDIQVLGTADLSESPYFTDILPLIEIPSGFMNAIPADVRVLGISLPEDGLVEVEMNQAFLEGAGGLLADFTMLNQLIYTLTAQPIAVDNSNSVLFLVDGEPVTQFGTEGLDLSDPVNRGTFIDNLAPIFLAFPIVESGSGVYVVDGLANTFEASVTVRVLDIASGEVTHEEFTTATCGTGCWGGFGVRLPTDLVVPGASAIQLLDYSAEDGSAQNVITIPIPDVSPWIFVVDE